MFDTTICNTICNKGVIKMFEIIKKNQIKSKVEFDVEKWEAYMRTNGKLSQPNIYTVNLTYVYKNVLYYTMICEYLYDKKKIVGVSLSVPKCSANEPLDSRVLGVFETDANAIEYIECIKKESVGKIAIIQKKVEGET
jgi:hypothetical protein